MRCRNAGRLRRRIAKVSRYFGEPSDGAGPTPEILAALKACCVLKDLELGKIVACQVGTIDKYAQTAIIDMYSRCGEIGEARKLFDSLNPCRDAATWNAMILGYVRNDLSSLALGIFASMGGSTCEPNARSFVAGLAACSSLGTKEQEEVIDGKLVKLETVERAMAIYSGAVKKGCHTEIFVANSMVDLCGKCGSLVDARKIFDKMECHDVVSWTSLILAYAENREEEIALELIELMERSGCSPNSRTFVAGLMACSSLAVKDPAGKGGGRLLKRRCLERGRDLHRRAVESGCGGDVFVASALIDMYSRCGSLEDAEKAFAAITPSRDPVPWNALIHGCVLSGKSELALEKFQRMKATGCVPNHRTYVAVLMACSSLAAAKEEGEEEDGRAFSKTRWLEKGLAIHGEAAKSQCDSDPYVASALVEMYARSGSMDDALAVFRKMVPWPTVAAWNSMILGYVASGESDLALKFFSSMDDSNGCRPDAQSFVAAIMAVSSLASREEGDEPSSKSFWLQRGIALHDRAAELGCDSDVYVASTLVDMYSKCGSMDRARRVFDKRCGAGTPDPDPASVSVVALNALLLGYAENGEPELALEIFESYEETAPVNERTFVAAMVACSSVVEAVPRASGRRKFLERGRRIHSRAREKSFDDNVFVANSLVDFYAKCGSMAEARAVFDRRSRTRSSSPVPWNSMILGYAASGENDLALELFASMRLERAAMDARTFVAALSACSNMVALQPALHAEICRQGLESREFVASSLVDFYAKCGKMGAACQVFDSIATKSTVLWNGMLAGYGCHGDSSRALEIFQSMVDQGIELGSVTLLSILTACSRAGLVETGKKIFAAMGFQPGIEHYQCMIDLLGRANRLEEALAMIRSMPYDATVVSWTTLLGACEKWKNVEIGELAFRSLQRLDENHAAAYTLMAKILAGSAGIPPRVNSQELGRNMSTKYKP